jgi:hypothetical protein
LAAVLAALLGATLLLSSPVSAQAAMAAPRHATVADSATEARTTATNEISTVAAVQHVTAFDDAPVAGAEEDIRCG